MAEMHENFRTILSGLQKEGKIEYTTYKGNLTVEVKVPCGDAENTTTEDYIANFVAYKAVCPFARYEGNHDIICESASQEYGLMHCPRCTEIYASNTVADKFRRMLNCLRNPNSNLSTESSESNE